MTAPVLTKKKFMRAAVKAFDAGGLAYQSPEAGDKGAMCLYEDDNGLPCIVGSALTPAKRKAMREHGQNHIRVGRLIDSGFIKVADQETRDFVVEMQNMHDHAMGSNNTNPDNRMKAAERLTNRLKGWKDALSIS